MRSLKETALYLAALALQRASQQLFIAAYRTHIKTCSRHQQNEKTETNYKVN